MHTSHHSGDASWMSKAAPVWQAGLAYMQNYGACASGGDGGSIGRTFSCTLLISLLLLSVHHRDKIVALTKKSELSAAVVFLPQFTADYGKHGSDKCYCTKMYGEVKPWGCKWFELWRNAIEQAVARRQKLQVFYFEGMVGKGALPSFPPMIMVSTHSLCLLWCCRKGGLMGCMRT